MKLSSCPVPVQVGTTNLQGRISFVHGDVIRMEVSGQPGKEALELNGVPHGKLCPAERGRISALGGFGFPHLGLVLLWLKLVPAMERRCCKWPGGISAHSPHLRYFH